MLKFYYHPLSPISRRVWIALLEKEIPFDPMVVDLHGKQFEEVFLAISPFHHVPVVVHGDIQVIESIAILDYLDNQFHQRPLSPATPADIARMRMLQLVVTNELLPKLVAVVNAEHQPLSGKTLAHLETCLHFLEHQLSNQTYFGGELLNLADIVAGSTVPLFSRLGVSLQPYPSLQRWQSRILERPAWQKTQPSDHDLQQWKRWIQLQMKRRVRERQQKSVN
ncbi:glutathione S-transferase family protein [Romeria aff. gracilis LEGE 07310]|uniref:Glutathione S-transferase family protein n=1 Tax=Vasconcelosia minhoensis LEGE 07310 TaxID=915328 RepID=A0A8J7ATW7_9CYAN|nr:glutathione S-transferase family protein [Romeria gracilis]MBE9080490.1 glutathione S-transferase family protein [Romeria aff. gracilis LEGE 07310]